MNEGAFRLAVESGNTLPISKELAKLGSTFAQFASKTMVAGAVIEGMFSLQDAKTLRLALCSWSLITIWIDCERAEHSSVWESFDSQGKIQDALTAYGRGLQAGQTALNAKQALDSLVATVSEDKQGLLAGTLARFNFSTTSMVVEAYLAIEVIDRVEQGLEYGREHRLAQMTIKRTNERPFQSVDLDDVYWAEGDGHNKLSDEEREAKRQEEAQVARAHRIQNLTIAYRAAVAAEAGKTREQWEAEEGLTQTEELAG